MAGVLNRARLDELVEKCLRQAALWEEVKDRLDTLGTKLSGGQQQRLTIARALSHQPEILCLDEFSIAVDPVTTMRIEEVLKELRSLSLFRSTRTSCSGFASTPPGSQFEGTRPTPWPSRHFATCSSERTFNISFTSRPRRSSSSSSKSSAWRACSLSPLRSSSWTSPARRSMPRAPGPSRS